MKKGMKVRSLLMTAFWSITGVEWVTLGGTHWPLSHKAGKLVSEAERYRLILNEDDRCH